MDLFETQLIFGACLAPLIMLYFGYWNFIKWCKIHDQQIDQLKDENTRLTSEFERNDRNINALFRNDVVLKNMYKNTAIFAKNVEIQLDGIYAETRILDKSIVQLENSRPIEIDENMKY